MARITLTVEGLRDTDGYPSEASVSTKVSQYLTVWEMGSRLRELGWALLILMTYSHTNLPEAFSEEE
jgi:hypothetical protein